MPPILLCHQPEHVRAPCGCGLLKQTTSQHKHRLTVSSEVTGGDETDADHLPSSLITCWCRCLRGSVRAHFPPFAWKSRVKVGCGIQLGIGSSQHEAVPRARVLCDFHVKGGEASHSRVHVRPLINCFTCSDSQLSQPPDSLMILLSSAFVSCCVCSCMINPPLLSSTTEISHSGRNNHPEVRSASQRKHSPCEKIVAQLREQGKKRVLLTLLLCRELEFWMQSPLRNPYN